MNLPSSSQLTSDFNAIREALKSWNPLVDNPSKGVRIFDDINSLKEKIDSIFAVGEGDLALGTLSREASLSLGTYLGKIQASTSQILTSGSLQNDGHIQKISNLVNTLLPKELVKRKKETLETPLKDLKESLEKVNAKPEDPKRQQVSDSPYKQESLSEIQDGLLEQSPEKEIKEELDEKSILTSQVTEDRPRIQSIFVKTTTGEAFDIRLGKSPITVHEFKQILQKRLGEENNPDFKSRIKIISQGKFLNDEEILDPYDLKGACSRPFLVRISLMSF